MEVKDEIEDAIDEILNMDGYKKISTAFDARSNPKFIRISYAIASKENEIILEVLRNIKAEADVRPTVLFLFDGFILKA